MISSNSTVRSQTQEISSSIIFTGGIGPLEGSDPAPPDVIHLDDTVFSMPDMSLLPEVTGLTGTNNIQPSSFKGADKSLELELNGYIESTLNSSMLENDATTIPTTSGVSQGIYLVILKTHICVQTHCTHLLVIFKSWNG